MRAAEYLATLTLFAASCGAVTLTQFQLSHAPASDICAPPPASTVFRTSDSDIWANFTIGQGLTGDVARVEWSDPSGTVAHTNTFLALPSNGSFCFDASLSNEAALKVVAPGSWTVRVYWNGSILTTRAFQVEPGIGVTILRLTRSDPPTCAAPPAVSAFQTSDVEIWGYLEIGNGLAGDVFAFEWNRPNGSTFFTTTFLPLQTPGGFCFTDYLSTAMDRFVPEVGTWELKIRVNDMRLAAVTFQVTSDSCTYSLNPTSAQLPSTASNGSVQMTAGAGCTWSALSNAAWLTITGGANGTGSGAINYSAAANPNTTSRSATITAGGQTATLTQAGSAAVSCTFTLNPASASVAAAGGNGSFSVNASANSCAWTAVSGAGWITIGSGSAGTGNGSVSYSAQANATNQARSGAITAGGQTFTLSQPAGAVSGGPVPQVTPGGVVNAASYMPSSVPGGEIARGSIFTIFGDNLGPEVGVQAQSYPIGTTLGGVSITVRQGNTTVNVLPIFVSKKQINAIMSSAAPVGDVMLTVTNNGTPGSAYVMRVASSNFGAFSVTSSGQGPGIIQNFNSATDQPLNSGGTSAKHRQAAILWGTGLGGIMGADNVAPPVGDLPGSVEIFVGGKPATKLYGGRAPCCAAEDQIVFEVPADAPEGCYVPVQVRTEGSRYSNIVTMAVERNGQRCSHTTQSGEIGMRGGKSASILLMHMEALVELEPGAPPAPLSLDAASAAFQDLGAGGDFAFNPVYSQPPVGSCITFLGGSQDLSALIGGSVNVPGVRDLDAGNELTATGNAGMKSIPRLNEESTTGPYSGLLGGTIPGLSSSPLFLTGGNYTVRGPGGRDVGSFQVSVPGGQGLTWTNRDQITSVTRGGPATVTWSGGDAANQIVIIGGGVLAGNASGGFLCAAAVGDRQFTIPASATANLPLTQTSDDAAVLFIGAPPKTAAAFSAPGLDAGYALFTPMNFRSVAIR